MVINNYFSMWVILLFIVWLLMEKYKVCGWNYINVYYLSLILFYGYIFFLVIDIIFRKKEYDFSFYVVSIIIHSIPLLILCKKESMNNRYALETLLVIFILYMVYLKSKGKNLVDIYLKDEVPRRWKDIQSMEII